MYVLNHVMSNLSNPHLTRTVLTGEDNPAFDGLFEFCAISAGGSVGAHPFYDRP